MELRDPVHPESPGFPPQSVHPLLRDTEDGKSNVKVIIQPFVHLLPQPSFYPNPFHTSGHAQLIQITAKAKLWEMSLCWKQNHPCPASSPPFCSPFGEMWCLAALIWVSSSFSCFSSQPSFIKVSGCNSVGIFADCVCFGVALSRGTATVCHSLTPLYVDEVLPRRGTAEKKIIHLLEIELYMLLQCENTNHKLCSQGKTVGLNTRKWIPDQGAGWHQGVSSHTSKNKHRGMHRNLDFSGLCLTLERDLLVKGGKGQCQGRDLLPAPR